MAKTSRNKRKTFGQEQRGKLLRLQGFYKAHSSDFDL
jgi:hypothetical protein